MKPRSWLRSSIAMVRSTKSRSEGSGQGDGLSWMEWRYDSFDDRWFSEGEVVIATMGEQNVWRRIKGKVAVDRENEEVIVYLHFGRKHWYFFQWKANQVHAGASDGVKA